MADNLRPGSGGACSGLDSELIPRVSHTRRELDKPLNKLIMPL